MSFRFKYRYATEVHIELPQSLDNNLEIIRFDPDNNPCVCELIGCKADSSNSQTSLNEKDIFLTTDPQYHFNNTRSISFATNKLTMQEVIDLMNHLPEREEHPLELFIRAVKIIYRKFANKLAVH